MEARVIDLQSASALLWFTGKRVTRSFRDPLDDMTRKVLGVIIIASALLEVSGGIRLDCVAEAQTVAAEALLEINALKRYPFLPMVGHQSAHKPAQVLESSRLSRSCRSRLICRLLLRFWI
jgi:hypothetical protein